MPPPSRLGAASPSSRNFSRARVIVSALCLAALSSCGGGSSGSSHGNTPVPEVPNPAAIANAGNFSTLVFLGDSLTAGAQNGSLLDTQQVSGYASLLAQQANVPITLPLIASPGIPNVMQLSLNPLGIGYAPGTSAGRDNPTQQPTNLAVPGATLHDIAYATPGNTAGATTTDVLGYPGLSEGLSLSQAQWAQQLNPTTIVLWGGNVEAITAVGQGSTSTLPSAADFAKDYTKLVAWLTQNTNAHLVLINIPDVTTVPYLISAQEAAAIASGELGVDQQYFYELWGVTPDDYLNANGLQSAIDMIHNPSLAPLQSGTYLAPNDITLIQSTVVAYNQAIAQQATQVQATLVDIHSAMLNLSQNGTTISGTPVNFQYLGGVFSLDGIHPCNTGYALVANTILNSVNSSLSSKIPLVDVAAIAATDPLFPANMTEQPYTPFVTPRNAARPHHAAQRSAAGGYVLTANLLQWRDQARHMDASLHQTILPATSRH